MMALSSGWAYGDTATAQKAREIFEKNKNCVVLVGATVKLEASGGGRSLVSQEGKVQVLGTVIDPSGLTVVALSAIDPAAQMNGRTIQGVKVSAKSEHSDVKINLTDGTEVPAHIVLKDDDLDMAFLIPDKKDDKLSAMAVKLEKAPELKVLDEVICLGRMAKALDQVPAVATSEITCVVQKPRLFYTGGRNLGGPVFTLDGRIVGITTAYKIESDGSSTTAMIILPAQDVMEIAQQALAKKDQPQTTSAPISTSAPAENAK